MVSVARLLLDTAIVWQAWYSILVPCYIILVFFPRSWISSALFSSGAVLVPAVTYLIVFTIGGTIAAFSGFPFISNLLSTSGDFGHIQVASAFAVTATAADLAFASILFRKYPDLPLLLKIPIAVMVLLIGWLLGVAIYILLRKWHGVSHEHVRLGPFTIS